MLFRALQVLPPNSTQSTRRPQPFHIVYSTSTIRYNNHKQTTKSTVCVNYDYATGYNTAVIQFCGNKSAKFLGKSWHITEQFYDFTQS